LLYNFLLISRWWFSQTGFIQHIHEKRGKDGAAARTLMVRSIDLSERTTAWKHETIISFTGLAVPA